MRRLFDWITTNSGSSLAAGATVLTVGVALGAVGLTEAQGSDRTPFSNGWLISGLAVAVVGAAWVLATFVATIIATVKAETFVRLLGDALFYGEQLSRQNPTTEQAEFWAASVCDLIVAGLGTAEGELFQSNHDLGLSPKSPTTSAGLLGLRLRLARLTRLIDRVHAMHVRLDFDRKQEWLSIDTWSTSAPSGM